MRAREGLVERLLGDHSIPRDHIAIVDRDGRSISRAELFDLAERMAAGLASRGVGPGDIVGVGLPRSIEWIAATLAIWRAGAAFLPLDCELPPARLEEYVQRSMARCVVVDEGDTRFRMAATATPASLAATTSTFEAPPFEPDRQAWLIFTSGSLGRPKGVRVTHRGVLRLLEAQVEGFGLGSSDAAAWLLSSGFDASLSDVGTALLAGATLHIADDDVRRNPRRVVDFVRSRRITYVDLPPSLLPYLDPSDLAPPLETMVIGGEVADEASLRRFAGHVRLFNVYGPTEATVCTSFVRCDPATLDRPRIGAPIAGVSYAVADEAGRPDPRTTVGELLISGEALADGYLGDPSLTAQRFPVMEGRRWFRSGDRVEREAHGGFVYLGRIDRQLKIRGGLVAPEEIEARLMGSIGVHRAAVVAVTGAGGAEIHAFVEGSGLDADGLARDLEKVLPPFARPHRFHLLDRLPTLPNGKADLRRLGELVHAAAMKKVGLDAHSPLVRRITGAFQRTLTAEVDPSTDFFTGGGDSLHMVRLIADLERDGHVVAPSAIVAHPTPERLAAAIECGGIDSQTIEARELRKRIEALTARLESTDAADADRPSGAGAILVTGATGRLGSQVIRRLLECTSRPIIALARGHSDEEAEARVMQALGDPSDGSMPRAAKRIRVVRGDLERASFDLGTKDWSTLASDVDEIFHCGADLSLMSDFERLWQPNVVGTLEVARLAATTRAKRWHLASTLSVFVAADGGEGEFREDDVLDGTGVVHGGYAQSKWAAEVLARSLVGSMRPTSIVRFGLLAGVGSSRSRRPDWPELAIAGLATIGAVPRRRDRDLAFDFTPVEDAAATFVELAFASAASECATYHVAGDRPVTLDHAMSILRDARVRLDEVDLETFSAARRRLARESLRGAAAALALARLDGPGGGKSLRAYDLFQATRCRFDMTRIDERLASVGIRRGRTSDETVLRWFDGIVRSMRETAVE